MNIVQAEKTFVQRMTSKNWSDKTISNYTSQVRCFLRQFQTRDRARNITANEIEQYLNEKVQVNTRKHTRCAIQAFYKYVVLQPLKLEHIPWPKEAIISIPFCSAYRAMSLLCPCRLQLLWSLLLMRV